MVEADRRAHYESFSAVTLQFVNIGPDWDDYCWIVVEPSESFRGTDKLFTAGAHCIPDINVTGELLSRGVEILIDYPLDPDVYRCMHGLHED